MLSNAETKMSVDRATFTITFNRSFTAPRERVFEAWTTPEHIQHWWDPTGARLEACVVDLRPGGAFKFTNQGSAHSPPFEGVYRVIERPSLLVFDAMGALGTVRLDVRDAGSHMMVSIKCPSKEHLEQFLQFGVDVGTSQTLDNLVTYLA